MQLPFSEEVLEYGERCDAQVDFTHCKHEIDGMLHCHEHKKIRAIFIICFLLDKEVPRTISCAAKYVDEHTTATVLGKHMDTCHLKYLLTPEKGLSILFPPNYGTIRQRS